MITVPPTTRRKWSNFTIAPQIGPALGCGTKLDATNNAQQAPMLQGPTNCWGEPKLKVRA